MSQLKRKDIADFFRSHTQVIPRKRTTPEPDGDTIIVNTKPQVDKPSPRTPAKARPCALRLTLPDDNSATQSPKRPLSTPKSSKLLDIPYRSPSVPRSAKQSLFASGQRSSQSSPKPFGPTSFSFADAPTSSRQVIEDGKLVAVQDSDDDDGSLASLTDILNRKQDEPSSSGAAASSQSSKIEEERVHLLSMYTGPKSNPILNRENLRALHRRHQQSSFDISFLVDEQETNTRIEEKIQQANAEIEKSTDELERRKRDELDKKMLAAILKGSSEQQDPDDLARVLSAIDRTEAFATEKTYSFFGWSSLSKKSTSPHKTKAFPTASIPHSLWHPRDLDAQNRAYLSRFMTDLASTGQLNDAALKWTFDSAVREPSEDLQRAYIECISAGSLNWTRANLTPSNIYQIFADLGADGTSLRDGAKVEPLFHLRQQLQGTDVKGLVAAIQLLHAVCQDMDFASLSKLTSTTSRLCLDQDVMSNGRVSQAIEDLIAKLVDLPDPESRQHVHERLISDLGTNLTDATLQDRFLSHFIPTSPSGAKLRIKLATHFLLGPKIAHKATSKNMKHLLPTLTTHVSRSPIFSNTYLASSNGPDYIRMTASIGLLDAAIADGHHQHSSQLLDLIPFSSNLQIPFITVKAEETTFNVNIDILADKLHDLFTDIADSGASHMRRTEAKDAIQALYYRLLHSVRTRPRRKKHVFDQHPQLQLQDSRTAKAAKGLFGGGLRDVNDVLEEKRGKDFMAKFLKKNDERNEESENEDEESDIGNTCNTGEVLVDAVQDEAVMDEPTLPV